MTKQTSSDFEKAAASQAAESVLSDFWHLLRRTHKWWLVPLVLVLLAFGALMLLGGTAAAPFIYTLF
jgi:hypothetical protein